MKTTQVKANTKVSAPKVLATYSRAMDCLALAAELGRQGRTAIAARAFMQAVNDPGIGEVIKAMDTTNAYGLKAQKLEASKKVSASKKLRANEEAAEDMSDEEIDRLLNGEDIGAETEDPTDGLESLEDEEDDPEEILEEADLVEESEEDIMDDDDGEATGEFASVIARLVKHQNGGRQVRAAKVSVKTTPRRK